MSIKTMKNKQKKEYCVHLLDNQGNTVSEIEYVYGKNKKEIVENAMDLYFENFGLEIMVVCQNCHTDNDYKTKTCENCEEKI